MDTEDNKEVKKMTKRIYKPDTTILDTSINPLTVSDFKIYINRVDIYKRLKDGSAAQVESSFEVARVTKLYVKSSNRLLLWTDCDIRTRDLWYWINYNLVPAQDYIWVNYVEYMKEAKCTSINTYKKALYELISVGLLAASQVRGVYWINPRFSFQGSRLNKYPDNIQVLTKKPKENGL